MILRQDSTIKKMAELFHSEIQHLPKYETPLLKGFTIRQPEYTENILNPTLQENIYIRSGYNFISDKNNKTIFGKYKQRIIQVNEEVNPWRL